MGIHKAVLTKYITSSRCKYLLGQWRRGKMHKASDIETVIARSLPARQNEIEKLKNDFLEYAEEEEGIVPCHECGDLQARMSMYSSDRLLRPDWYCYDCWCKLHGDDDIEY